LESRHINVQCERAIIQGARRVKIFGRETRADLGSERVLRSHRPADLPRLVGEDEGENIFLVHGKEDPLQGFANAAIENKPSMRAYLPAWKEAIGS